MTVFTALPKVQVAFRNIAVLGRGLLGRAKRSNAYAEGREREYGEGASDSYRSRADYVLTCEMWEMPSGGTWYYLLDYQLVQLRDAETGPNLGAGAIVWENKYEVKFQ